MENLHESPVSPSLAGSSPQGAAFAATNLTENAPPENLEPRAKRGRGRPPGPQWRKISPQQEFHILMAVAEGETYETAGRIAGVSKQRVEQLLKKPYNTRFVQKAREVFKTYTSEEIPSLAPKMVGLWKTVIQSGDAKGVDAMSRAYLNLDRISASVSGEFAQKELTVTHQGQVNVDMELDVLLRGLLGVAPIPKSPSVGS